jgi:lycopene beta-cyclase
VHDIVILGSGPAGWATATACSKLGMNCALISANPETVWTNTYGGWADDLSPEIPVTVRWEKVLVQGNRSHVVGRTYVQLDNARLHEQLRSQFTGKEITATVETVIPVIPLKSHNEAGVGFTITFADARRKPIHSHIVIDATGGSTTLLDRPVRTGRPVLQTAYGVFGRIEGMPYPGAATLMDWTGPNHAAPSFLYALDYGNDHWLVEETSLAHRPGLSQNELRTRLETRLQKIGARIVSVQKTEEVSFAMDLPLPTIPQQIIGIGAAASVVHPATGYSVAASLRAAPKLAQALAKVIDIPTTASPSNPAEKSRPAWDTVWPADRLSARRLEHYGMERMLLMDQQLIRSFFDTFFSLPAKDIAIYQGGESSQAELAAVMWKVFSAAPFKVRAKLASGNPFKLARTLLGP